MRAERPPHKHLLSQSAEGERLFGPQHDTSPGRFPWEACSGSRRRACSGLLPAGPAGAEEAGGPAREGMPTGHGQAGSPSPWSSVCEQRLRGGRYSGAIRVSGSGNPLSVEGRQPQRLRSTLHCQPGPVPAPPPALQLCLCCVCQVGRCALRHQLRGLEGECGSTHSAGCTGNEGTGLGRALPPAPSRRRSRQAGPSVLGRRLPGQWGLQEEKSSLFAVPRCTCSITEEPDT